MARAKQITEDIENTLSIWYGHSSSVDPQSTDASEWLDAAVNYSSDRRLQKLYLEKFLGNYTGVNSEIEEAIKSAINTIIAGVGGPL